jgi:acetyl-CoA acetyltransferase
MGRVAVLGVGLTKFIRDEAEFKIDEAASQAALSALRDARMRYKEIEMALCGNIYQTGAAPMVFYPLGKTGIPIARIDIACASASRAIQHAAYMIEAGAFETCLVVGVERMPKGMVPMPIDPQALSPKNEILLDGLMGLVTMPAAYAHKATRYMHAFGAKIEHFAQVSVKAHKNGCLAPHAMYQKPIALEEVVNSRMIAYPITLYQCCANANGAAAVVLASEKKAKSYTNKPVYLSGWGESSMHYKKGDPVESFLNDGDTRLAARKAYEMAGVGPEDVDVVQLHDAFAPGEVFQIEALGLVPEGEGWRFVQEGHTEIAGRMPVNTDGGLLSCGHPVGATGARMVAELVWQLRGQAGARQVKDGRAKVGLLQNSGLGASNVLILQS